MFELLDGFSDVLQSQFNMSLNKWNSLIIAGNSFKLVLDSVSIDCAGFHKLNRNLLFPLCKGLLASSFVIYDIHIVLNWTNISDLTCIFRPACSQVVSKKWGGCSKTSMWAVASATKLVSCSNITEELISWEALAAGSNVLMGAPVGLGQQSQPKDFHPHPRRAMEGHEDGRYNHTNASNSKAGIA